MSELRTHAPGPWWVDELPRLDVTPDLIPTAWEATALCCAHQQKRPGHEQRQLLRCLARQRQHANAPFTGGRTVHVFHRCVAQ